MIEQAEKQFIPQQETITPQVVEIETGGSVVSPDSNDQISLQPISEQSPSILVTPAFEAPNQVLLDSNVTTGDRWNEAIKNKERGVAPKVL